MKLIVNPHKIEIEKTPVNEKEINVTTIEFEFNEEITNDYVKEAYFTINGESYKQIIVNNECNIPGEVLEEKGQIEIGVVAYLVEDETEIKRYNPSPVFISTLSGSLKDAKNTEPITPSEMEQFEQALQVGLNAIGEAIEDASTLDIDATKTGNVATITITKQDGTTKEVEINDGLPGEKGEKGNPGNPGPANTLSIGSVTGGTTASATITGTSPNQILNLVLPKGDKGETGPAGSPGVPGSAGKDGSDGFSPIANVNKSGSTSIITIIDKNGTTTSQVNDGANGQDGYTPVKGVDYFTPEDIASLNIPSALNELSDDTTHRTVTDTEKTTWNNKSDFSGNYNDLTNKPVTSDLLHYKGHADTEEELPSLGQPSGTISTKNLNLTTNSTTNFSNAFIVPQNLYNEAMSNAQVKTMLNNYTYYLIYWASSSYRTLVGFNNKNQVKIKINVGRNNDYCIVFSLNANVENPIYLRNSRIANQSTCTKFYLDNNVVTSTTYGSTASNVLEETYTSPVVFSGPANSNGLYVVGQNGALITNCDIKFTDNTFEIFDSDDSTAYSYKSIRITDCDNYIYSGNNMILLTPTVVGELSIRLDTTTTELNDTYTVGENYDIYRRNENVQWDKWAKQKEVVTSISSASTDEQVPTAKAVYDYINSLNQ